MAGFRWEGHICVVNSLLLLLLLLDLSKTGGTEGYKGYVITSSSDFNLDTKKKKHATLGQCVAIVTLEHF